jgi:hypothetical protein
MGTELVAQTPEWKKSAKEWYERGLGLQQDARELRLDVAEHIMQGHDQQYYKTIGYATFGEFTDEFYGISRETAHQYLRIAQNVMAAMPDDLSARLTTGDNPLPLKVLAALHFGYGGLTPEVVERVRKMKPEEQKEELLKLGYDRERMGGRCASDLLRGRLGKKGYRDQRKQIVLREEQIETLTEEKEEMAQDIKDLKDRLEQVMAAIKDPHAAQVVKQMDGLTKRLGELEKVKAEVEAKIATGREVETRALQFIGEAQGLVRRFYDTCVPDTVDGWIAVHDAFETAGQVLRDARAKMAEDLVGKMAEGQVEKFDPEDPRMLRDLADSRLKPGAKR